MRLSPQAIRSVDERSEALSRSESHKKPRRFGNASGPMPFNLPPESLKGARFLRGSIMGTRFRVVAEEREGRRKLRIRQVRDSCGIR